MNARAGWEKYHFLHRKRVLQQCEGRYMGRERKRGALNALNRLLLTGESEFEQDSARALAHRFSFVITLDAGTRMLPGTALKLIGTMAHPLNRAHTLPDGRKGGYSILAPRMELPADAVASRFIELYGGSGGVDSYPTAVSDLYQDACGQGIFGGKGIYDVAAFEEALHGKLPDNGFNGIPAALLASNNPIGVIFGSIFLRFIDKGGYNLAGFTAYNEYVSDLIIAVIIYFAGFSKLIKEIISRRKGKTVEAVAAEGRAEETTKEEESK